MAIQAILFDVYGTLLNVHSAVAREGKNLAQADAISRAWRQKQLEYTWVWSLRAAYHSFRALTEAALDHALAARGVASPDLRARLLSAYERLDPFPEVAATLAELRTKGVKLAALSNGDPDLLETGLASAGVRASLDAVLSIAPLGVYKPDRRVYELGRAWAGCAPADIGFVSANAWDAGGAAGSGFRTFWVNRTAQPPEYEIDRHATVIADLSALADALR
jgi:2-haloacid dehalogenase